MNNFDLIVAFQVREAILDNEEDEPIGKGVLQREYLANKTFNLRLYEELFNKPFVDSKVLLQPFEIQSFLEVALRLSHYSQDGVIESKLKQYGYLLVDTTKEIVPLRTGYESLRKKINRTTDQSKKDELIKELCQLYIDHNIKPKRTFKYFNIYRKIKVESSAKT